MKGVEKRTYLIDDTKNEKYWELKEEAEDRKGCNGSLSHGHEEQK